MPDEQTIYGHIPLTRIPEAMAPWGLRLASPGPSEYGHYALVGCEQSRTTRW